VRDGSRGVPADLILQSTRNVVVVVGELTSQDDSEIGSVLSHAAGRRD
jgi:hypothetical protein